MSSLPPPPFHNSHNVLGSSRMSLWQGSCCLAAGRRGWVYVDKWHEAAPT